MTDKIVYMIHDRESDAVQSCYSRANTDVTEFSSAVRARSSNCNDTYQSDVYRIDKYKVVYELIQQDCDKDRCKVCKGTGWISERKMHRHDGISQMCTLTEYCKACQKENV